MSTDGAKPTVGRSMLLPTLVPTSVVATFLPPSLFLGLFALSLGLIARRFLWRRRDAKDDRAAIWKLPLEMLLPFFAVSLLGLMLSPVISSLVPLLPPTTLFDKPHTNFGLVVTSQLAIFIAQLLLNMFLVRLVFPSSARAVGGGSRMHVPLVAVVGTIAAVDLVWRSNFSLGQLRGDRGLKEGLPGSGRTVAEIGYLSTTVARGLVLVLASGFVLLDMWTSDPSEDDEGEQERSAYKTLEWGVLLGNAVGLAIVIVSLAFAFFSETPVGHIVFALQSGLYLGSMYRAVVMLPPPIPSKFESSASEVYLARNSSLHSTDKAHAHLATEVAPLTPELGFDQPSRPASFVRHSRVPSPFLIAGVDGIYIGRTGGLGRSAPSKKPPGGLARLGVSLGTVLSIVRRPVRSSSALPMQDKQVDRHADLKPSLASTDEWEVRMHELHLDPTSLSPSGPPRPPSKTLIPRRSRRKTVPAIALEPAVSPPVRQSTISSGIGMAMMGLQPPPAIGRPPSLYTPDESAYMLADGLFLANPDDRRSSAGTLGERPPSRARPAVKVPSPVTLPVGPTKVLRWAQPGDTPEARRPKNSRKSAFSRPPVPLPPTQPPPDVPGSPDSHQTTTGTAGGSVIRFGSPVVSWGSAADAYTFILPNSVSVPSPLSQSASKPPSSVRRPITSGEFPTTPDPSRMYSIDAATTRGFSPSPIATTDAPADAQGDESKLPQLPVLTSAKRLGAGGRIPVSPSWKATLGTGRGGVLARAGTASSRGTEGSSGDVSVSTSMGEEYDALEAYMEGRVWK